MVLNRGHHQGHKNFNNSKVSGNTHSSYKTSQSTPSTGKDVRRQALICGQNHFESNLAMTNKGCPPNKSVSRCPPRETLKAVLMEIKMVIMVLFYKDKEVERTYLSRKRDKLWFIITINAYG